MKILVLGASGMAGHVISLYLREQGHDVDTTASTKKLDAATQLIDVRDGGTLQAFLKLNAYDAVVNCVGILVKQSEQDKPAAIYINSYLPRLLEQLYDNSTTKVVHISTDGVFSGKHSPYDEQSICDSELFYGRTKSLGEISNAKDITFRTSIIGPEVHTDGHSLFGWLFGQRGTAVTGYTNVFWNGVTTLELARTIAVVLGHDIHGMYHLARKQPISKYDLLAMIKRCFDLDDITINEGTGSGQGAVLVNSRSDIAYTLPGYQGMLDDLKRWMEAHREYYAHYYA